MRILHLTRTLDPGGVTMVIADLAAAQARIDEVAVGALRPGEWDDRISTAVGADVVPAHRLMAAVGSAHVVHVHHRTPATLLAATPWRHKVVEHIHNKFDDKRIASFRIPRRVAVSHDVADHVFATFDHVTRRPEVILNGVPGVSGTTRDRPSGVPVRLLAVGRMEDQKDPVAFGRIVRAVHEAGIPVVGTWVGEGSHETRFRAEFADLLDAGVVELRGYLDRIGLRDLMAGAHALLITSRWEGLPLVALEALSVGSPVLTTNCGDIRTVIVEAGAGAALPWDDPSAAARVVVAGLDDTVARQRSANAVTLFERDFALDAVVARWRELYRSIAQV